VIIGADWKIDTTLKQIETKLKPGQHSARTNFLHRVRVRWRIKVTDINLSDMSAFQKRKRLWWLERRTCFMTTRTPLLSLRHNTARPMLPARFFKGVLGLYLMGGSFPFPMILSGS
jgi:hypothetical protein